VQARQSRNGSYRMAIGRHRGPAGRDDPTKGVWIRSPTGITAAGTPPPICHRKTDHTLALAVSLMRCARPEPMPWSPAKSTRNNTGLPLAVAASRRAFLRLDPRSRSAPRPAFRDRVLWFVTSVWGKPVRTTIPRFLFS